MTRLSKAQRFGPSICYLSDCMVCFGVACFVSLQSHYQSDRKLKDASSCVDVCVDITKKLFVQARRVLLWTLNERLT